MKRLKSIKLSKKFQPLNREQDRWLNIIISWKIFGKKWIITKNLQIKCSEDAAMFRKFIEREQIFEFLADLNVEFDEVRVQVLGKEDLSSINEVFSIIGAEEGRRGVMIDSQPAEGSTLATTKPRDNNFKGVNSGQGGSNDSSKYDFSKNKDNVWCTYCKKPQHMRETC